MSPLLTGSANFTEFQIIGFLPEENQLSFIHDRIRQFSFQDIDDKAEDRMQEALKAGFLPMAMFFRDQNETKEKPYQWAAWQRRWARPAIMAKKMAAWS